MRDPKRIQEILSLLTDIWTHKPDLRFMQLILILQAQYSHRNNDIGQVIGLEDRGNQKIGYDMFYVEDDGFIKFLLEYKNQLKEK